MLTIKGTIRNGVVEPAEPLEGHEGEEVVITLIAEEAQGIPDPTYDPATDPLLQLIDRCQVDAGPPDLAHQHDHYLYGTPKKPPAP